MPITDDSQGDFQTIARSMVPSDLEVMRALLESERIPAFILDGGINQVYSLLAVATGGARLQVASEHVAAARRILTAFETGQLALDDDVIGEERDAVPDKRRGRALSIMFMKLFGIV
jgi:Putative prokaryotic signal transducing protein